MNIFEKRNNLLGMEFDRYIREHPEFSSRIPDNAHIILLMEGDVEDQQNSPGRSKRIPQSGSE